MTEFVRFDETDELLVGERVTDGDREREGEPVKERVIVGDTEVDGDSIDEREKLGDALTLGQKETVAESILIDVGVSLVKEERVAYGDREKEGEPENEFVVVEDTVVEGE